MPRALFSVHDKTNLIPFATTLVELGWDLIASGGTQKALEAAGLPVTSVDTITGMPEMLGGRVKTLHPAIHAGILMRDIPEDIESVRQHGYTPINMVVCNLYPFQETVAQPNISLQDAIEQIDIGGVAMLRAAAKNFLSVAVVCNIQDYSRIAAEVKASGSVSIATRRSLAVKAFALTRDYDTAIHAFLSESTITPLSTSDLPQHLSLGMQQLETLRYGENPHQVAAYYGRTAGAGPLGGKLLGGKEMSYNNMLDTDAAWRAVLTFPQPTVVIVKHLTPVGIATANTITEAYSAALASDPVSAFGGIIAVNRPVDSDFVQALGSLFIEVIVAPNFTPAAVNALAQNRKNCRLLEIPLKVNMQELEMRSILGGVLMQSVDVGDPEGTAYTTVTERIPTPSEMNALQFAWKAVQHVKSNAIVVAEENATLGIGGGLPSRLDAARLAVAKAGERSKGAVMASDAFFPFADGLDVAIQAGIKAVIQPGGSIRDKEVIQAANEAGIAMVFTGVRHFRH